MDKISVADRIEELEVTAGLSERIQIGQVASQLHFDEFSTKPEKDWDEGLKRSTNVLPPSMVDEAIDIVQNRLVEWKAERAERRRAERAKKKAEKKAARELAAEADKLRWANAKQRTVEMIAAREETQQGASVSVLDGIFDDASPSSNWEPSEELPASDLVQETNGFSDEEVESLKGWLDSGKYLPVFYIGVPCVIDRTTRKAIHCLQGDSDFWLPQSRIMIQYQDTGGVLHAKVDVPLWLVVEHEIPIKYKPFSEDALKNNQSLLEGLDSDFIATSETPYDGIPVPIKPSICHSNNVLGADWYEKMQEKEEEFNQLMAEQAEPEVGCIVNEVDEIKARVVLQPESPEVLEVVGEKKKQIVLDNGWILTKRSNGAWRIKGDDKSPPYMLEHKWDDDEEGVDSLGDPC